MVVMVVVNVGVGLVMVVCDLVNWIVLYVWFFEVMVIDFFN